MFFISNIVPIVNYGKKVLKLERENVKKIYQKFLNGERTREPPWFVFLDSAAEPELPNFSKEHQIRDMVA